MTRGERETERVNQGNRDGVSSLSSCLSYNPVKNVAMDLNDNIFSLLPLSLCHFLLPFKRFEKMLQFITGMIGDFYLAAVLASPDLDRCPVHPLQILTERLDIGRH